MSLVGVQIGSRVGSQVGIGATARTDSFFDFLGIAPKSEFAQENDPKIEAAAQNLAQKAIDAPLSLAGAISAIFKPKASGGSPPATPPANEGGGSGDSPAPSTPKGRPARFSDFKTAAKIAAAGGAVAGAGIAINETAKQLGDTVNDAVHTTGQVFDNIGNSAGSALKPILDPLGITDPTTQSNIGKWLVIGGAIALGLFVTVLMVKSKK